MDGIARRIVRVLDRVGRDNSRAAKAVVELLHNVAINK